MKIILKNKKFLTLTMIVIFALTFAAIALGILPEKEIGSQKAIESVKKFADIKDEDIKGVTKDDRFGKTEVSTKKGGAIWLDSKNGKVVGTFGMRLDTDSVDSALLPLSKEECVKRAEQFLRTKEKDFDKFKLTIAKTMPDSSYELFWENVDENGASSRTISIDVDPKTGGLWGYISKGENINIDTTPKISKEEAISIVKKTLTAEAIIKNCSLQARKDNYNQQRLVWSIWYVDYGSPSPQGKRSVRSNSYLIDAKTGEDVSKDFGF